MASGPGSSNQAFDDFNTALSHTVALVSAEFNNHITSASHHLRGVAIGISAGFLAVAVLVLFGFQQRIKEYR
ncbi:MAG: hypothetical protein NVSMB32_15150 [Actinomycetota bacterium]